MKKTLVSLAFLASASAHAYTDCQSTIFFVYNEISTTTTPGQVYVALTSGINFSVPGTNPDVKTASSIAQLTLVRGGQIKVRFAANSVSCTSGPDRTDVVGIHSLP